MELIGYLPDPAYPVDVRPLRPRRRWMDETPEAFAYRCLPLASACGHGWEICTPVAVEAVWNGGPGPGDVTVRTDGGPAGYAGTHFGSGILSFAPGVVLRTPPEYNLWLMGPPNAVRDGIQPLNALIEADWMPFTFSMNWKFTRPDTPVRFEAGDPIAAFFPVPRGVVEACEPVLRRLDDVPEAERQYLLARRQRRFRDTVNHLAAGKGLDPVDDQAARYQGWYTRGELPDGSPGPEDHRKKSRPRPFRDERL